MLTLDDACIRRDGESSESSPREIGGCARPCRSSMPGDASPSPCCRLVFRAHAHAEREPRLFSSVKQPAGHARGSSSPGLRVRRGRVYDRVCALDLVVGATPCAGSTAGSIDSCAQVNFGAGADPDGRHERAVFQRVVDGKSITPSRFRSFTCRGFRLPDSGWAGVRIAGRSSGGTAWFGMRLGFHAR